MLGRRGECSWVALQQHCVGLGGSQASGVPGRKDRGMRPSPHTPLPAPLAPGPPTSTRKALGTPSARERLGCQALGTTWPTRPRWTWEGPNPAGAALGHVCFTPSLSCVRKKSTQKHPQRWDLPGPRKAAGAGSTAGTGPCTREVGCRRACPQRGARTMSQRRGAQDKPPSPGTSRSGWRDPSSRGGGACVLGQLVCSGSGATEASGDLSWERGLL